MVVLDDDRRWNTFGLLLEAYRAVDAAIELDTYDQIPLDRQVVDLLIRIARTPKEGLRPAELAEALATTRPHMTNLIDRAQDAGLVRRRHDQADRRTVLVALTTKGRRQAIAMSAVLLDSVQSHIFDVLTLSEIDRLEFSLQKLRDASNEHRAEQSKINDVR